MLGIGWTEMLVVGVVALIVIGPKELPALMQKLGRFAGTVRRMGSDFQRELNRSTGLNEVTNLRNAITQPLKSTTDAIRKEFNATSATGEVKPSGALKPADPGSESVVNEIHAAAGMTAAEAPKPEGGPRHTVAAPAAAATTRSAQPPASAPAEGPRQARKKVTAGTASSAGPGASEPVASAGGAPAKVARKAAPKPPKAATDSQPQVAGSADPNAAPASAASGAAKPKRKRAAKKAK